VNRDLGAASFGEKRKVYAKSSLALTKGVSDYVEWNRVMIEKRQAELAKLAAAAWRFD
jgi:hypothetical protein